LWDYHEGKELSCLNLKEATQKVTITFKLLFNHIDWFTCAITSFCQLLFKNMNTQASKAVRSACSVWCKWKI